MLKLYQPATKPPDVCDKLLYLPKAFIVILDLFILQSPPPSP